uniref:Right handed beta helix domain-containing protein n=1 Tax=Chromera velia CCMP2878 TaxID=1169474 RepID=A0A0G4HXG8_9ALVE|eukprot:Cvel_1496.t1-p1 / transcript=Cvel_1496.t1 / gene=Cvel_1496 / organism=Chromera_velia_CCMP2878 / gene_product=hypothetical protein / transcript_product=hypothetical protein / location=Cvel_scaffold52:102481-103432(+) / protein_length=238 / sequence_SO=supercontig / SO=protein_coding / is_pseudo=false
MEDCTVRGGVSAQQGAHVRGERVEVTGTQFNGVSVGTGASVELVGSRVHGNGRSGVSCNGGKGVHLLECEISNNGWGPDEKGVGVECCSGENRLVSCRVEGNRHGVGALGDSEANFKFRMEGCSVSSNRAFGILVRCRKKDAVVEILKNECKSNTAVGILVAEAFAGRGVIIEGNKCELNGGKGILVEMLLGKRDDTLFLKNNSDIDNDQLGEAEMFEIASEMGGTQLAVLTHPLSHM